jgi:transposase
MAYRDVVRARIVLACDAGVPVSLVARRLGVTRPTIRLWRDRFAATGELESLDDAPRSGRPARIDVATRCELVQIACRRPDEQKVRFRDVWTREALVEALRRETGVHISVTEAGRILRAEGLRPHRTRYWLHSPDPDFRRKVKAICDLYVNPPAGATVLCIDEKTCIQALSRKTALKLAAPGREGRQEFEYRRHGTRTLIGAFDVGTGEVFAHVRERRTTDDILAFMEDVASRFPGEVYVVWDNLNIHCGEQWTRFSERHGGRFHFVHTPIHASWVNQIEVWFGILHRRVLKYGNFTSVRALADALRGFVAHWNRREKHPFRWTFRGSFEKHRRRADAKTRQAQAA